MTDVTTYTLTYTANVAADYPDEASRIARLVAAVTRGRRPNLPAWVVADTHGQIVDICDAWIDVSDDATFSDLKRWARHTITGHDGAEPTGDWRATGPLGTQYEIDAEFVEATS